MREPNPYLNIAAERKILPEGMSFKAIICEDASQVRMVGEEHTIHVPYLVCVMYMGVCVCDVRGCMQKMTSYDQGPRANTLVSSAIALTDIPTPPASSFLQNTNHLGLRIETTMFFYHSLVPRPGRGREGPGDEATFFPDLSLQPVGTAEDGSGRVHWCEFIGVSLHTNPRVVRQTQQVVDQL